MRAVLTEEEEHNLVGKGLDFSILEITRDKAILFLLGPVCFLNHDCKSNSRFVATRRPGMRVIAIRNIAIGEEITINYFPEYFGENNSECLCKTCEGLHRNGWMAEGHGFNSPKISPRYHLRHGSKKGSGNISKPLKAYLPGIRTPGDYLTSNSQGSAPWTHFENCFQASSV